MLPTRTSTSASELGSALHQIGGAEGLSERSQLTPRRTIRRRARRAVQEAMRTLRVIKMPVSLQQHKFNCELPLVLELENEIMDTHSIDVIKSGYIQTKQEQLREWCINYRIPHNATNGLLEILREWLPSEGLCKDARTLLKTPRKIEIQTRCGGQFYHFGISNHLHDCISLKITEYKQFHPQLKSISHLLSLKIGVDGVPVSKSSKLTFWPILMSVDQAVVKKVYIISLFYGLSKPNDLDQFLQPFIHEMKTLEANGFSLDGNIYNIRIRCICADAPARSFLKKVKPHNAYYSCERCNLKGTWSRRVIYPIDSTAQLYNDETFRNQIYKKHHDGFSPLVELKLGMISQIPLDYMHLICLGVMKKLLISWVEGPRPHKLSPSQIAMISDRLVSFQKLIPCEFKRKPRSLRDVRIWKATEFRLFVLYIGPAALIKILDENRFKHFLLLHCAVYIFSSKAAESAEWVSLGANLVLKFVSAIPQLYHSDFLTYNMHCLQHVHYDVSNFGRLDNFSCFEFESFLYRLKNMLRSNCKHISQVVKRFVEADFFTNECGSKVNNSKVKIGDCFLTVSGHIGIVKYVDNEMFSITYYKNVKNVKLYPCVSSYMYIYNVKDLSNMVVSCEREDLFRKCILLPYRHSKICVPLCHDIN